MLQPQVEVWQCLVCLGASEANFPIKIALIQLGRCHFARSLVEANIKPFILKSWKAEYEKSWTVISIKSKIFKRYIPHHSTPERLENLAALVLMTPCWSNTSCSFYKLPWNACCPLLKPSWNACYSFERPLTPDVALGALEPPLVPQIAGHCLPLDSHPASKHTLESTEVHCKGFLGYEVQVGWTHLSLAKCFCFWNSTLQCCAKKCCR